MLDEFPALGRLDFFESALAFMAGYGLRAFLIAQSLNQIEKAYGPNNSILDNCHVRVAFATNDERTAKRISDALGTTTEMRAMRNYAGHRLAPWLAHVMVSRQETARQLLTPGEVMQLPGDEELVLVSGQPPIRAKKLRYFEDANFSCRVIPSAALAAPNHPYGDRPPQRPDDWGRDTKEIDDRLATPWFDQVTDADEGGKDLKPDLPVSVQQKEQTESRAADKEPSQDVGESALAEARRLASRSYGLDRGTPKLDLLDF